MNSHKATRELDAPRIEYRHKIIPKPALAIMDAETSRLAAPNLAAGALKMGDAAPDFILPDAHGEPVRLYSLLSEGHVVVVFYPGGWCPYCNLHLRGFQPRLARLRELDAQIVAISPQVPDDSICTQEKNPIAFPVLSDVGNEVARQFGIVVELCDDLVLLYRQFGHALEDANGAGGNRELPLPATFLIDSNATIRLAHVDVDHTRRLDPDYVIETLKELKDSNHLET